MMTKRNCMKLDHKKNNNQAKETLLQKGGVSMLRKNFLSSSIGSGLLLVLALLVSGCDSGGGGNGEKTPVNTAQGENVPIDFIVNTGAIVAVRVGELATLDGSRSSASSGDALTFAWEFSSKPDGSQAELVAADSATPSFTPDVRGTYHVQLVVSAGGVSSPRGVALVEATLEGERPTGPFNHPGLSNNCINCHTGTFATSNGKIILGKSGDHVASSNMCQACHTTFGYGIITFVDHKEVFGSCSLCHDGVKATGKGPEHPDTTAECDACHNTVSFLQLGADGKFDHSNIGSSCGYCHNGKIAIGKPAGHIETTADCLACHVVNDFKAIIFDHRFLEDGQACGSCHGNASVPAAIGKPQGHVATNQDCGMCHNTLSFGLTGMFDHTALAANVRCDSCHDGQEKQITLADGSVTTIMIKGLSASHMPIGNRDCKDCHAPGSFANGTYDHAGITGGCATCHDGVISTGKTVNHVPTEQDCSVCHQYTDNTPPSFAHGGFSHTGIIDGCFSCHDGVQATGMSARKNPEHIPALNNCEACHTIGGAFSPSTFAHKGITKGCGGCHNGSFTITTGTVRILGKDAAGSHLPTNLDCYLCHKVDISDRWKTVSFAHNGVTGNCASCHTGTYPPALGKPANHPAVAIDTATGKEKDCSWCHGTTDFTKVNTYDHSVLKATDRCDKCHDGSNPAIVSKPAGHVVTTQDCKVCHVVGNFKSAVFNHTGITSGCAACHDGVQATGKGPNHITTSKDCSVCHNTTAFAGAQFDHTGVVDKCSTCHNGKQAMGMPTLHIPTTRDCHFCHNTAGFKPGTMDHTGITGNCRLCHDGTLATGKPAGHITTSSDCGVCHNTTTFKGAVFDHTGITTGCIACHDGAKATGKVKPSTHLPTSLDCYKCHDVTSGTFQGGTWDHTGVTGNCVTCHNGQTLNIDKVVTGPSAKHLKIGSLACEKCHNTKAWAPDTYTHPASVSSFADKHNAKYTCNSDCHWGKTSSTGAVTTPGDVTKAANWRTQFDTSVTPNVDMKPQCGACHVNQYSKGSHSNKPVSQKANCGGSGCHSVSKTSF